eukprot:5485930-Amphidinium_carterae.1
MARNRFEGELSPLTEVLSKHISNGRSITYPETLGARITKVEREALAKYEPLLKELSQLQPSDRLICAKL